jgi:hypothetical protein
LARICLPEALLHALGVDLKVQQELLRHADIRTTMNIYRQAVPTALREVRSKVVRLVREALQRGLTTKEALLGEAKRRGGRAEGLLQTY